MLKKTAYITVLVLIACALPVFAAQHAAPTAVRINNHRGDSLQRCGAASGIVFTNLTGPNAHKYNNTTGYFVDGANFFHQVLAHGFTPSSTVSFADVLIPMGVYTDGGGDNNAGTLNVYLESDA